MRRSAGVVLIAGGVALVGGLMYLAGWHAASAAQHAPVAATPAQGLPLRPEMIPVPAPNGLGGGQGPNQECQPVILFYYQGRLYQLMPGPDNQQGQPTSPPEYFPLRPYQGPQIPGLPFGPIPQPAPQSPGFQPLQPRF